MATDVAEPARAARQKRPTVWTEAGMRPVAGAPARRGIVCLHPDPDLPDPKRMSRFRAKGGVLVGMMIRERVADERRQEARRVAALIAAGRGRAAPGEADGGAEGEASAARPRVDAMHRGKRVGRAVLTHPLDLLLHHASIDADQHAAGLRLREAIEGSWPSQAVTARPMYVSDPGEFDEDDDPASDEDRWAAQAANAADVLDAERHVSRAYWTTTRHVCAGGAVTGMAALVSVQSGLRQLAQGWRVGKKSR